MKKLYLFCIGMFAFSAMNAQEVSNAHVFKTPDIVDLQRVDGPQAQPRKVKADQTKSETTTIALGSAGNVYSAILNGNNQVSYNSDINSIVFIHRENGTTGNLRYDLSTDGGTTWDVDMGPLTPEFDAGNAPIAGGNRYPNMVLWNPDGNTDADAAYMVGHGPALSDVTGTWGNLFEVSANLDGSNISEAYVDPTENYESFHPYGMVTTPQAVWSLSTTYNNDADDLERDTITYANFYLNKGVVNTETNSFDWTVQEIFTADWARYDVNANGFDDNLATTWSVAFNQAGTVGYAVVLGAEISPLGLDTVPKPVVWKTMDSGDSWDRLPEYDYSSLQAFTDNLGYDEATQTQIKPYFSSFDMVVDANDNLHIFTHVLSGAADLGFVFTDLLTQGMFHLWTVDGTEWTARFLAPKINNDDGAVGAIGLDERIQASRSEDGNALFMTWQEDDDAEAITFPDIMAIGYDVVNDSYSFPKNLTTGTDYEEFAFWQSMAPMVITDGEDEDYELPIVFSEPTGTELDPLQFYYLKGAGFSAEELQEVTVGIEESSVANELTVFPNPTNGYFSVSAPFGKQVELNVYDLQGRKVINEVSANGMRLIDANKLTNGIYIVELIVEGERMTTKLVKE